MIDMVYMYVITIKAICYIKMKYYTFFIADW
jgi:hypothetical protein